MKEITMEIKIRKVSKFEFNNLNYSTLFEDKMTDRVFGVISNGVSNYKMGWQSDTIIPLILKIKDNIYLIGIDQYLVIFDFKMNKIILKTSLDYYFYDAKVHNNNIYIITELEILKINLISFKIIETYALPDYFQRIEFKNEEIELHCLGDNTITIPG